MIFFKKAFSLYQQTGALLVVLIVLTSSIFYIVLNSSQSPRPPTTQTLENQPKAILPQNGPYVSDPEQTSIASVQSAGDCSTSSEGIDVEEQKMTDLINDFRAQNNRGPLALNPAMNKAAAWMAEDMAAKNYLNHVDSLGRDPRVRLADCGYSYPTVGENSAMGPTTQQVFDAWLASSAGHRENLLNSSWMSMGIARAQGTNNNWYWTNDFSAQPFSTGAVTPTATSVPTVTLTTAPTQTPTPQTASPSPTPTLISTTPSPSSSKIALDISLTGIGQNALLGQNPNPIKKVLSVNIEVFNTSNQKIKEAGGNVEFDLSSSSFRGEISLESINPGVYRAKVKLGNSLSKFIPGIITLNTNQVTQTDRTELILGDLNGDNELSLADYNLMSASYEGKPCAQKDLADLNLDGKVDELDLNVLYSGFSKREGD